MYGQLGPVTENGIAGQRLQISNASNHGNIGFNALDLSFSDSSSSTRGATGSHSFATGYITIAFGDFSSAMGEGTTASGNRTLASGYSTTASGNRSTAMGNTTTANGYSSTAMGNGTTASGNSSTAMGNGTTASGVNSIAMGNSTTASGVNSTAIGNGTTASGNTSAAMGNGTTAFGTYSTAMGLNTTASDFVSLVIGQHNLSGSSVTSSATEFDTANTAFVIGNGTNDSNKSDAFKVMFNGNTTATGSVTATSFIGDGSQLSGIGILSAVTENNNTGARLSTSNASNHGNIGYKAVDLSYSNSASTTLGATGWGSIAMGKDTTASFDFSTAMGSGTTASGGISTAMGNSTTASGSSSTAMGNVTVSSGDDSTAMGNSTTASGNISTAMGLSTTASGVNSIAMGSNTTASGAVSTAMGVNSTASGNSSTAMGRRTTASDYGSLVIGQYNLSGATVTNSATSFNTANTAFVIGNGADGSSKSDAFSVLFSGETVIGNDLEVKGSVLVSSDARLKANIVSLGATLAKLLLIDGKSYTMKKDGKQKIGVLAQDIQKVFPELVSTDDRDMLAVNYQGLVPVLINAMKEQQAEMKEQEKRLERLEAIISKMDK